MTPSPTDILKTIEILKTTKETWAEINDAFVANAFQKCEGVRKKIAKTCGYSPRYIGYMANKLRSLGYPVIDTERAKIAYARKRKCLTK